MTPADLAACAQAPLLAGLDDDDLAFLLAGARRVDYPAGGPLFTQGDPADRFFVVLAGRATLYMLTENGERTVIELFDPVCTFAEAAMFSTGLFPLHGEVSPDSRLVHIPAAAILPRLAQRPDLAMTLLAALSRWRSRLSDEIARLKSRSPAQRLAAFLLGLAGRGEDKARIHLPLAKTILASRIGIAPESLSRALARLRAHGVEARGREIILTDRAGLRRFCGEDEP